MKDKKIIVLHIINKMDRAGAETFIMNVMRAIDPSRFCFRFLVKTNNIGQFDDEILKLGGEIYHIKRFNGINYFSYIKSLKRIFMEHPEIDIVHSHQGSSAYIDLKISKSYGKKTIAHSHSTFLNNFLNVKELLFKIVSFGTRFIADYYIGCSQKALFSRYGKNISKKKKTKIINNGININKYRFSYGKRMSYRNRMGISENSLVFLFIGRLIDIKNPIFALSIFKEIYMINKNVSIIFAGSGPLSVDIQNRINGTEIQQNVYLVGNIDNVDELLSAGDCLLMTSLKEGFPVTLVEAQCSSINCLVSDCVTREVVLSNKIGFYSINKNNSIKQWVNAISLLDFSIKNRSDVSNKMIDFSDERVAANVEAVYCELMQGENNE